MPIQRTFAAGEVAPTLWARADVDRWRASLKTCVNFRVRPEGGLTTRTGTQFVGQTKTATARIIPFVFSDSQTYVLEFSLNTIRFWKNGAQVLNLGLPYEVVTTLTDTIIGEMKHAQSADVVYLVHNTMEPLALTRYTDTDWRLATHPLQAIKPIALAPSLAGTVGTDDVQYQVTGFAGGLETRPTQGSASVATQSAVGVSQVRVATTGAHGYAAGDIIYFEGQGDIYGQGQAYAVDVPSATTLDLRGTTAAIGLPWNKAFSIAYKDTIRSLIIKTPTAATPVTVSWTPSAKYSSYNIYRKIDGVWGFVGNSFTGSFIDTGIQPDTTLVFPPRGEVTDYLGFPGSIDILNQRIVYGGWSVNPEAVAMTPIGNYKTVDSGLNDADGFNFNLASQPIGTVRNVSAVANKVIVLTSAAEWMLLGDSGGTISPTQINARKQSSYGSSTITPAVVGTNLLYANRDSSVVRECRYSFESDGLQSRNMSIWSPHLFKGITLVRWAYTEPLSQLGAVRSDGVMLGLTYLVEQDVWGWYRYTTSGLFKDICVVPESGVDRTYVLVDRVIGGVTRRYLERFAVDQVDVLPSSARQLDSFLTYVGAPATAISGLAHLEGQSVRVLGDGGVQGPYTVVAGAITISPAASVVVVGLAFTADAQTLPIEQDDNGRSLIDAKKNVIKLKMHVADTSGFKAGTDAAHLDEVAVTLDVGFGAAEEYKNGMVEVQMDGTWDDQGSVLIRQDNPLPLTLLSIAPIFRTGGK